MNKPIKFNCINKFDDLIEEDLSFQVAHKFETKAKSKKQKRQSRETDFMFTN
jgi:hypothetical protein